MLATSNSNGRLEISFLPELLQYFLNIYIIWVCGWFWFVHMSSFGAWQWAKPEISFAVDGFVWHEWGMYLSDKSIMSDCSAPTRSPPPFPTAIVLNTHLYSQSLLLPGQLTIMELFLSRKGTIFTIFGSQLSTTLLACVLCCHMPHGCTTLFVVQLRSALSNGEIFGKRRMFLLPALPQNFSER